MTCILKTCAWGVGGNCKKLGECGAAYALARAAEPGGYRVHSHDNKTIVALQKAGIVDVRRTHDDSSHFIVTANESAARSAVILATIEDAA